MNADAGQLGQVVQNLVINGAQAMPDGGTLRLEASNEHLSDYQADSLDPGCYIRIDVRDEGAGIREEIRERIFDPFFTTRDTGTGLGLSVCDSIVRKHGGCIEVNSSEGQGTCFSIFLPAAEERAAEQPHPSRETPKGEGRLLVVDDEETIRQTCISMLQMLGYRAEGAANSDDAVKQYRNAAAEADGFRLVLMDLTLRGGPGGCETMERLQSFDPNVRAIVCSGYAQDPVMANASAYGFCGVVSKPYTLEELSQAVSQALGSPVSDR